MDISENSHAKCEVCSLRRPLSEMQPVELVDQQLLELVREDRPKVGSSGQFICLVDLGRYRMRRVQRLLAAEAAEVSGEQQEVLASLRDEEHAAELLHLKRQPHTTAGQRLADRIAALGGSWGFIGGFFTVLLLWISINTAGLLARPFDPYPFILLNLALSCLAAIQAPVILMSQNRQEALDRVRAENDFHTNLQAELEIRSLHSKIDLLLTHQWQRLLEIQEKQERLLAELAARCGEARREGADESV